MKPIRMAPLNPAIAPPRMKTVIFNATAFLPSAFAAISFSRMARSERPYGELITRCAMKKTITARTNAPAVYAHR